MRVIKLPDLDATIREIVADPEAFVRETRRWSARAMQGRQAGAA